jgi:hypothetical protein
MKQILQAWTALRRGTRNFIPCTEAANENVLRIVRGNKPSGEVPFSCVKKKLCSLDVSRPGFHIAAPERSGGKM